MSHANSSPDRPSLSSCRRRTVPLAALASIAILLGFLSDVGAAVCRTRRPPPWPARQAG
jgi:hypothetical protein